MKDSLCMETIVRTGPSSVSHKSKCANSMLKCSDLAAVFIISA